MSTDWRSEPLCPADLRWLSIVSWRWRTEQAIGCRVLIFISGELTYQAWVFSCCNLICYEINLQTPGLLQAQDHWFKYRKSDTDFLPGHKISHSITWSQASLRGYIVFKARYLHFWSFQVFWVNSYELYYIFANEISSLYNVSQETWKWGTKTKKYEPSGHILEKLCWRVGSIDHKSSSNGFSIYLYL